MTLINGSGRSVTAPACESFVNSGRSAGEGSRTELLECAGVPMANSESNNHAARDRALCGRVGAAPVREIASDQITQPPDFRREIMLQPRPQFRVKRRALFGTGVVAAQRSFNPMKSVEHAPG